MKELSFERMETIEGGGYCDLICYWMGGGAGYQGDYDDLIDAWANNCLSKCSFQMQT